MLDLHVSMKVLALNIGMNFVLKCIAHYFPFAVIGRLKSITSLPLFKVIQILTGKVFIYFCMRFTFWFPLKSVIS